MPADSGVAIPNQENHPDKQQACAARADVNVADHAAPCDSNPLATAGHDVSKQAIRDMPADKPARVYCGWSTVRPEELPPNKPARVFYGWSTVRPSV